MHVAVVGATGAVGRTLVELIKRRKFPLRELKLYARHETTVEDLPVEILDERALRQADLIFFCAGKSVSAEFIPKLRDKLIIDLSSYYRMQVPLVIPEVNGALLEDAPRLIASPNCTATLFVMALKPLMKRKIRRVVASTYQAASGGGAKTLYELEEETRAHLEGREFQREHVPFPYAFNLFLHPQFVEEERKILEETRKMLALPDLALTATCVRVPVKRAHSVSMNVEFDEPFPVEEARALLARAPGVALFPDGEFPMPIDATGRDEVLIGRVRQDVSHPNALEMWVVGDQLLKGAALNALQIAERLSRLTSDVEMTALRG